VSGSEPTSDTDIVRVLVADDHPVLREVIKVACQAAGGLEVVGGAEDGAGTLAACRALRPDVLVVDLNLPDMDGLDVVETLRAEGSRVRVLVLSGRSDPDTLLALQRAEVDGYLEKTAAVDRVTGAIRSVARGERVFAPQHEQAAIEGLRRQVREARVRSGLGTVLTRRETEILRLLAGGRTSRQIASALGISPRTVESHIAKVYEKLGGDNRAQAVARAVVLDLVNVEA
jgi:two-component system nitrate/nitrite response regulator NarL